MNEESLRSFGAGIQRLIDKQDLTRDETYSMFKEVLTNVQPDVHQGAFLAALVSKSETAQEIAGAWQAIQELDTTEVTTDLPPILVENSGTGMDSLKTFNVSSASAVIAAASGATMARHGARALTSFCGTVDILESVGLDVECDIDLVENSIKTQNIGLFNGMSPKIHPSALGRILSQIRFGSTLNIAASLASPARPTCALRGVYTDKMIHLVADVMQEIGYTRAMVVSGKDNELDGNIDEISVTGPTTVVEFTGSERQNYVLQPEDVGLETQSFDEVAATGNIESEKVRFLQVLAGKGHRACVDFTCLNAGAVLYLAGISASVREGVELSRDNIENGSALTKLRDWIATQNTDPTAGINTFSEVAHTAGIA